jgi:glycosyltransferase involved in cell wall biosynthesis
MNILHITTAFQRNKDDIITPWLVNLLKEQSKEDSVFVLTSGYCNISSKQRIGKIEIHRFNYAPKRQMKITHDMTIQDYIQKNPLSIMLLPVFFISGIIKCAQLVKKKNIDTIIVHWPFPLFFIALPAKNIFKKKIVSVFYGAELKLFKNKFKRIRFIFKYICKSSSSVVAISNATADEVKELSGLSKVTVIPYGVKIKEWRENKKENLILTVGRQVERKGTEYLIKAMNLIESSYKLVIVGNGPLLNDLKKIATSENLSDRVIFTGWISDEALVEYYKKAKIFVLPAIYDSRGDTEGLGMVLVEAMMHGAVCVATGIGGITDIIKDGETGLFSKEKNPKDIAEKINMLIINSQMYSDIKNSAYKRAVNVFSLDSVNSKYRETIKSVQ